MGKTIIHRQWNYQGHWLCEPRQVTNHAGLHFFFLKHALLHIFHNSGVCVLNDAYHRLWRSELLWSFSHVSHSFLNPLNSGPNTPWRLLIRVTNDLQVAKTKSHVSCFYLTFDFSSSRYIWPFRRLWNFFLLLDSSYRKGCSLTDLFSTQSPHVIASQASALSPIPLHSHQGSSIPVAEKLITHKG